MIVNPLGQPWRALKGYIAGATARLKARVHSIPFTTLMPGLALIGSYQRDWLLYDLRAGISVAAVALPVAIAYAELAGVGPMTGLYSSIFPLLIYALFGTSRQLIVGPDAATCAVITAVVTPLALGNPTIHVQLVVLMTAMTGVWCLISSRFKLGVFADFLSKPILMGLINGVAIAIIVGQLPKIFGFSYKESYLVERLLHSLDYLSSIHPPTFAMSLFTLLILLLCKRKRPQWPAAMLVLLLTIVFVWLTHCDEAGIAIIGPLNGVEATGKRVFSLNQLRDLVLPALNLAMVSFVSMMLTARSFASKNGYDIDSDQEFTALGLANLASACSMGFAVSGADSRTAVNDANGGKSQLVSVIAAVLIGLVTLFLLEPLQYIPVSALGIILIMASLSLIDLKGLWALRYSDSSAFWLALITFIGVLSMGVIRGIALAVLLGLFQFLRNVMRPTDQLLGIGDDGLVHTLGAHDEEVKGVSGVLLYRFNSPLTYFNAPYFKRRLLNIINESESPAHTVIIDAITSLTYQDISVMTMIGDLHRDLQKRGTELVLAGRVRQSMLWLRLSGLPVGDGENGILLSPDIYQAIREAHQRHQPRYDAESMATSAEIEHQESEREPSSALV